MIRISIANYTDNELTLTVRVTQLQVIIVIITKACTIITMKEKQTLEVFLARLHPHGERATLKQRHGKLLVLS